MRLLVSCCLAVCSARSPGSRATGVQRDTLRPGSPQRPVSPRHGVLRSASTTEPRGQCCSPPHSMSIPCLEVYQAPVGRGCWPICVTLSVSPSPCSRIEVSARGLAAVIPRSPVLSIHLACGATAGQLPASGELSSSTRPAGKTFQSLGGGADASAGEQPCPRSPLPHALRKRARHIFYDSSISASEGVLTPVARGSGSRWLDG